jgi:hypothetical protein
MSASPDTSLTSFAPGCRYQGEIVAAYATPAFGDWLNNLPATLAGPEARLIYQVRNRLYRLPDPLDPAGAGLCVKAFAFPSRLRRLIYRSAGSKAARAHRFARHLQQHGAGVTLPVGYAERWEGSRLVESYLLTRFLDGGTDLYSEMSRLLREDPDAEKYLALLRFAAGAVRRMHDSGFVHHDLGGQNLLLRRNGDAAWADPGFIDLNRGRILPALSLRHRARDLAKLEIPSHFRRIFFHIYFDDGPIPSAFLRWEAWYRARITLHNESRKFRHPIRDWLLVHRQKFVSTGRPAYRDIWLWDAKSGQPSVVLDSRDRTRHRASADLFRVAGHNLRRGPALWQRYRKLRPQVYAKSVDLTRRFGISVEVTPALAAEMQLLAATPGLPVFVRCYFHQGAAGLAACTAAIEQLAARGHEVSLGLIQSRRAVLFPDEWQRFLADALGRLHRHVRFVEIGHAVNRVKWGTWNFPETVALWSSVAGLRRQYPHLTLLGPAINDFEFHHYPPLLARLPGQIDGLSCHLYVDRRGAPENYQGRFSLLEKCVLGRAMAEVHGCGGFYITETNWPLRGTGEYSPLAGAYTPRHYVESPLHVDEKDYAAFMVRYALIALCSGMTERVWWWRLAARGYGLADDVGGLRPRPAWAAMVHFHRLAGSAVFSRREERDGALWWHFDQCTIVYALAPVSVTVPAGCVQVTDLTGLPLSVAPGQPLPLTGSPVYFLSRNNSVAR